MSNPLAPRKSPRERLRSGDVPLDVQLPPGALAPPPAAIPRGRVATYGQLAALLGQPRGARAVGWALRALPDELDGRVPWQRRHGWPSEQAE